MKIWDTKVSDWLIAIFVGVLMGWLAARGWA